MLVQIPHDFFAAKARELGFELPAPGEYAIGALFLPRDPEGRKIVEAIVEKVVAAEGQIFLGWRDAPVDPRTLAKASSRRSRQAARFSSSADPMSKIRTAFERRLFLLRKVISNTVHDLNDPRVAGFYPFRCRRGRWSTKACSSPASLATIIRDLADPKFVSALALVHQRFSTNTFPTWSLSHPYRMVAHNGEINTLRGNVNWMAARQASVASGLFGDDISKLWPISYEGQSDTACFDNALEFLVQGGYSLAHAMMMLIPEAWAGNPLMDEARRAFYEYHAAMMEPWDGPAAVAFTDGRQIGATLDRNGLRPARYIVTDDGLVVLASEVGVLPIPEERIVAKWRLQPGKMLLVDLEQGRIISDDEMKNALATRHPYAEWLKNTQIVLEESGACRAALDAHRRLPARPSAGVRLHAGGSVASDGANGGDRSGGGRLNGHGYADLGAVLGRKAALHLFQAEFRAGDQSADRSDPRGAGHEPRLLHRAATKPARSSGQLDAQAPRGAPADPDQQRSRKNPFDRSCRGSLRHQDARHHLQVGSRRRRHGRGDRAALRRAPIRR